MVHMKPRLCENSHCVCVHDNTMHPRYTQDTPEIHQTCRRCTWSHACGKTPTLCWQCGTPSPRTAGLVQGLGFSLLTMRNAKSSYGGPSSVQWGESWVTGHTNSSHTHKHTHTHTIEIFCSKHCFYGPAMKRRILVSALLSFSSLDLKKKQKKMMFVSALLSFSSLTVGAIQVQYIV